jgi:hypothetical protein
MFWQVKDAIVIWNKDHKIFTGVHESGFCNVPKLVFVLLANEKPRFRLAHVGCLKLGCRKRGVRCVTSREQLQLG